MTGTHTRRVLLQRCQQPCLFAEFDDIRCQRRCARIARLQFVQRAIKVSDEAALIDFVVSQDRGDVAVCPISHFEQPVLDLDIIMSARQRQSCCRFQITPARLIQPTDELFKIDCGHAVSPDGGKCFPLSVSQQYVLRGAIVQYLRGA